MFGTGFSSDPVVPPTAKARALVVTLRYILYIQLFLGILKVIYGSFMSGLSDFIACWILYQAYSYLNHCNLIIYSFFTGLNTIELLAMLGTIIQNSENLFQNSYFPSGGILLPTIEYLSIIFYTFSLYYCFQAYKEFKAIMLEHLGGFGTSDRNVEMPQYRPPQQYGGFGGSSGNQAPSRGNPPPQQSGAGNRGDSKNFSGRGIIIG